MDKAMKDDKDISAWASVIVLIIAIGVWAVCTKSSAAIVMLLAIALIEAMLMPIFLWIDENEKGG